MGIKLVVKVCALLALVAIVEVAFLLSPLSRAALNNTFYDAWAAKHSRLVAPGQHRLIIVGGSSSAFGIDSAMLESFTSRTTINLGLHGGLGLALMLNEIEDGARPGDLVVLIPEYELFYGDLLNGALPATQLLQHDRSALKYFSSWRQWRNLMQNTQVLTSTAAFAVIDQTKMALLHQPEIPKQSVYRIGAFDAHGDVVAHLTEPSRPAQVAALAKPINGELNRAAIAALARCADVLTARGVEVVLVYPAVAEVWWAINHDRAEQVAGLLPSQPGLPTPADWVFDDGMFFDTPYHLNARGREQRTERLVRLLVTAGKASPPMLINAAHIPPRFLEPRRLR